LETFVRTEQPILPWLSLVPRHRRSCKRLDAVAFVFKNYRGFKMGRFRPKLQQRSFAEKHVV